MRNTFHLRRFMAGSVKSLSMGNIKNQVMTVVVSVFISLVLISTIWIFPTNQFHIDIINIAGKQREVKTRHLKLRDIAKCFKSNPTTKVFVLVVSAWLINTPHKRNRCKNDASTKHHHDIKDQKGNHCPTIHSCQLLLAFGHPLISTFDLFWDRWEVVEFLITKIKPFITRLKVSEGGPIIQYYVREYQIVWHFAFLIIVGAVT
mmetsp:Transcript_22309/g.38291  ORF Transcript_22309/g.38291 Transcript_22309/m.38291 type:complete len:204 (+) Transcript_22309:333-944(+)